MLKRLQEDLEGPSVRFGGRHPPDAILMLEKAPQTQNQGQRCIKLVALRLGNKHVMGGWNLSNLGFELFFSFIRDQIWVQLGFELLEEFELFQGSETQY